MQPPEVEHLQIALGAPGDPGAFEALLAPRRTRLLLLLAATLGDWAEAEDALQDAVWKAFCGLRALRAPEAFDPWLRRLVLNVARDHLRAALRRQRREGFPAGDAADLEQLLDAGARADGDDEGTNEVLRAIGTCGWPCESGASSPASLAAASSPRTGWEDTAGWSNVPSPASTASDA